MTLQEVTTRLQGRIGRTNLLHHLRANPFYAGGPTHRKNGSKFLFTPGDYARMLESLSCPAALPSKSSRAPARRRSTSEARSPASAYSRALELLKQT